MPNDNQDSDAGGDSFDVGLPGEGASPSLRWPGASGRAPFRAEYGGRLPPVLREGICTFRRTGHVFEAMPQRTFRPRGLMVWGAPLKALVRAIVCRDSPAVTYEAIPARWFSMQQSFEQLAKALDEGKEPASWGDWNTVRPGMQIRIELLMTDVMPIDSEQAEEVQLLMWGHAVE